MRMKATPILGFDSGALVILVTIMGWRHRLKREHANGAQPKTDSQTVRPDSQINIQTGRRADSQTDTVPVPIPALEQPDRTPAQDTQSDIQIDSKAGARADSHMSNPDCPTL